MARRTDFGRDLIAGQWAMAEFAALARLWQLTRDTEHRPLVPYPVQARGRELMLEFIGEDDGSASPRLAQVRTDGKQLVALWHQMLGALGTLADERAGARRPLAVQRAGPARPAGADRPAPDRGRGGESAGRRVPVPRRGERGAVVPRPGPATRAVRRRPPGERSARRRRAARLSPAAQPPSRPPSPPPPEGWAGIGCPSLGCTTTKPWPWKAYWKASPDPPRSIERMFMLFTT